MNSKLAKNCSKSNVLDYNWTVDDILKGAPSYNKRATAKNTAPTIEPTTSVLSGLKKRKSDTKKSSANGCDTSVSSIRMV